MTVRPTRPVRNAAKAIIVRDGRLLATVNRGGEGAYYLLPGGGQEPGESLADCVRRECREEVGAEVEVRDLRFVRDYIGRNHEFAARDEGAHVLELMFECRLLTEPAVRGAGGSLPDLNQTGVAWLPLDRIEEYPLYPRALRPHLRAWGTSRAPAPVYVGDIN